MSSLLIYICLSVAVVCTMAAILIHANFTEKPGRGAFRVFTILVCIYMCWYTTGCVTYPEATPQEKEYMMEKMLSYEEGTVEYEAWRLMLVHSK